MKIKFSHKIDLKIKSGARFRDNLKLMQFPEFPFIKVILINTLAMSIFGLGIPLSIQSIINNITSRTMIQPLLMLCLILFFILSFSGILQALQTYTVEILKRRVFVRFGLTISERMTYYQDAIFKKENSPALINRYFDVLTMQSSLVTFIVDGFGFFIMFIIGFGLLIFYHPYFLIFGFFMAAFLVTNWLIFGPDGVRAGSPEADGRHNVVTWIEELSRVRTMFTSENGRAFSNKKMVSFFNHWLETRNTLFNFQFRQHLGLQIFGVLTNVLLLFTGGLLVLRGELSLGQLVAAALIVSNISSSLPRLQNFFFSVYDYSTSLDKLAQFYDYPLEEESHSKNEVTKYHIEFKDVFVEPNYSLNFRLPYMKRVFVLVNSFSTIDIMYNLMCGHVTASTGVVFLDDKHLDDIDYGKFRNKVQMIKSDQFFAGTIKENLVGFSHEKIGMARIVEALEKIGMWEMVNKLPLKLETQIRPNGYPLSKSQLLTLQVGRALLNRPAVLFITPDFEQISSFKRKLVFKELMDPHHHWTLLFFSQKYYSAPFDQYSYLNRNGLHLLENSESLLKEIEKNV